jgi:hypothetical protein
MYNYSETAGVCPTVIASGYRCQIDGPDVQLKMNQRQTVCTEPCFPLTLARTLRAVLDYCLIILPLLKVLAVRI